MRAFLHLRNVSCELELNLRIKTRKRLKRDKPDALAVPEAPNMTSLSRMQACAAGPRVDALPGSMHCPVGVWLQTPEKGLHG